MRKRHRVLLIEDDTAVLEQVEALLVEEGFEVASTNTAEEGLERLENEGAHLVLTDLCLPGADGLEVVERARSLSPYTPVVVMTAHASIDTAVDAMRRGAFHYLEKPFSADSLLEHVKKAVEHGDLAREREVLRKRLSADFGVGRILGESPAISTMRETILEVADTDSNVLVSGETGTGKELVVNALHYESRRAGGPLVKVNCAALSETLLESELFGHEKGAFTGAERKRAGKFERADGGTLFLDEITEMSGGLQAKLLRVLQGAEFERVGGDTPLHVDVRVVAATNRDPEEAVKKKQLREDLYFRLNVIRIDVPPLRDRPEDIPLLAESFLTLYAAKHRKKDRAFSPDAKEALRDAFWPGNVRELENVVERAVILSRNETVHTADIRDRKGAVMNGDPPSAAPTTLNLGELERKTILRALKETGWVKAQAAKKLGVFPSSLYKKMKRLDIPLQREE